MHEAHGRKARGNESDNKHECLSDEEEKEEEQEHQKMSNEKESSDSVIHNENHKCEENESFEWIKKLKGDVEKAGTTCDTLERKIMHVEERHKTLVEKLKTELCSVKFLNQEEEHLEA